MADTVSDGLALMPTTWQLERGWVRTSCPSL